MQQAGLMPAPAKAKREQPTASEPLSFTAPDGCTILVGRNNLQNERLTRSADSEDWWLHAKDIPGSHVIVKTNGGELSDAALQMAAGLAACYSQARQSSKVPVDYTRKKHVRKPSGSPPGFVIYTHQQTVMVEPHCPVQPEE
jgi:predicted ribosome quality control (RQC) complex YloA/Tae2 family protein